MKINLLIFLFALILAFMPINGESANEVKPKLKPAVLIIVVPDKPVINYLIM